MFEIKTQNDVKTLFLSGEVDLDNSPTARDMMLSIVNLGQAINIDLAAVEYIDSSGVSVLIEALQKTKKDNIPYQLVNVSVEVMGVLELANLDNILPIESHATTVGQELDELDEPDADEVGFNPFSSMSDSDLTTTPENIVKSDTESEADNTSNSTFKNPFIG
jgi:anti-sigma B factor antagonist